MHPDTLKMPRNVLQRFRPTAREFTDSGLSAQVSAQSSRILGRDGRFRIKRPGIHPLHQLSLSHELITMPWFWFLLLVFGFYSLVNLLFALAYFAIGMDQFMGAAGSGGMDHFLEALFFSAQTLTTVGYGRLNPAGFWPNVLASIEALTGLLSFAIVTGLVYGRFSRPVASLVFSRHVLISPFQEGKGLMFRLANRKTNDLCDVEAQVLLSLIVFENNLFIRKYFNLDLERKHVNSLALAWTVVHPISSGSPFVDMTPEMLQEMEGELLVTIKGFDTTFSQTVISRTSYHFTDFVWNARFLPAFGRSEDGSETQLFLHKLHDYIALGTPNGESQPPSSS